MLWLIPAVPMVASGVIAVLKQPTTKAGVGAGDRVAGVFAAAGAGCVRTRADGMVAWISQCARR